MDQQPGSAQELGLLKIGVWHHKQKELCEMIFGGWVWLGGVVFSFQGQNGCWNDPKIVNGVFGH